MDARRTTKRDPNNRAEGLYLPAFEHDACGVGVVANVKGRQSHEIISNGLEVLTNLAHRGASGSDPETGDGAGILIQIPDGFLRKRTHNLGFNLPPVGSYAVGNIFFPQDPDDSNLCQAIVEETILQEGQQLLGWRDVPVNPGAIGQVARETQPTIRQVFVGQGMNTKGEKDFQWKLYVLRKVIEEKIRRSALENTEGFYVCSLSNKLIVYKGLLLGTQIRGFYPDLADTDVTSSFALVHSRFSTNTLGTWNLAHPYRFITHNGEINTLRGNINWLSARQGLMDKKGYSEDLAKIFPIITPGASDTASIDNAIELLLATGRPIEHVMMMLIPEASGEQINMPQEKRNFYDYHACFMEPWDGPALIAFTDGAKIGAVLDRNGLRPFRYVLTRNDLLVMASEVGVLDIPTADILFKGRLEPGKMFLVDPNQGGILDDTTVKSELSRRQPYGRWLAETLITLDTLDSPKTQMPTINGSLTKLQETFGYTSEDLDMILTPMATTGSEPIGSMGNDVPIAVLSKKPQSLFNYFKQLFAQVTNPPLDAIREELVTSLEITLGSEQNIFEETAQHARQLKLRTPILTNHELQQIRECSKPGLEAATISTVFPADGSPEGLGKALENVCNEASDAINRGKTIIILSDRPVGSSQAPIPSLLAVSSVHHHLIREGIRAKVGLVVESGEPREVAHFAALIGYGAGAINPYLAYETLLHLYETGRVPSATGFDRIQNNYIKGINKGLLKIISKMGISTISSYKGAQIFEAVGLHEDLVDKHFTSTPSRIGGIGLEEIQADVVKLHQGAYRADPSAASPDLSNQGFYYWRRDGEYHMWNPDTVALLQHASRTNDYETYKLFASLANDYETTACTLRGLLGFRNLDHPIPLDEVESASVITKRLASGAISLGAISREAHETLSIAMNRIGGRSNSGEGGEDYHRYNADANGDQRHSRIKQVASGRFGVTTNYLVNASDLQIKMAQGSKPGEGGQLPGGKVDSYIGWVRNSTPGVELISPPPHHDIYSIEDLAQLIHDLKTVNPTARIHVKLVAEAGVGTIAAGVSKAHADVVLISGDSGGTGASPESSIKHAGLPWELGIAETQQVLVRNDLRGRIVLQADGQIKTGRDVAIACLLGAEEFGIATAALVTLGCIMLRKCHLNTCSVGIATQDPELRKRFTGKPEFVINYFRFVAEELREIMARLGFRTIDEMVGRVDKLNATHAIDHWKTKGLDLSKLLYDPNPPTGVATHCIQTQDHGLHDALDHSLIESSKGAIENQTPVSIVSKISNSNRTVGAMLSGEIAKKYGEAGLPDNTITCKFTGSAGQSFAAFLTKGISFTLEGDSNDYLGKGISGGQIVVVPPQEANFRPEENIIIGNVSLYGATGGSAFIRGRAGERFCVRNSGAVAVVEGVGDHGCEYMTNGRVVVLGPTGRNFAAGMSGGIAYVFNESGDFERNCNQEMVDLEPVEDPEDQAELAQILQNHYALTNSSSAKRILQSWANYISYFVKVYPRDYRRVVEAKRKTGMTSEIHDNG
ncbi:MAG: glutamate synthase large subunit [SAR202 cluster bacterium]|nr:glutamate synthase large subunit [SAR202 cluster bacterium]